MNHKYFFVLLAFALTPALVLILDAAPISAAGVATNCTFQGLVDAMNSGNRTITFNCGGPATITLTQYGGLNVDAGGFWTIDGGNLITFSGMDTYRLFNVKTGGALTLTNIILTNGYVGSAGYFPNHGGALLNTGGLLVLDHATVRNNKSTFSGGAIETTAGTTVLLNSVIENNQSDSGGGIYSQGVLTLTNVTVSGNKTIGVFGSGGIANYTGTATLINTTLSGNQANYFGGGIYNTVGTATLINVTLSGNSAINGGGIYRSEGSLGLRNTIVANSLSGGNCSGAIISNNFNLSSDNTCTPYFNQTGDWNNENPYLGPLANNGGPTQTHVPFPPSKAIDGGSACPSPDQRGVSQPQGLACDIGAVEHVSGEKSPWLYLPLILR